jgi:predicted nucleotidyltransferase
MFGTVKNLISTYLENIQKIYGAHLKSVILYGSYARGDYNSDSDVDIMILVDLTDSEIEEFSDELSELVYEYNVENDIWIMPIVKNIDHFRYWENAYPFYRNVRQEGVVLYETA